MNQPAITRAFHPFACLALAGLLTVVPMHASGQTAQGSTAGRGEVAALTSKAAEAETCVKTVKLAEAAAKADIADMGAVIQQAGMDFARARDAVEKALESTKDVRMARNKAQEIASWLQSLEPAVQSLTNAGSRALPAAAGFEGIMETTRKSAEAAREAALDAAEAGDEGVTLATETINRAWQQAMQGKSAARQLARQIKLLTGESIQTALEISAVSAQIAQAARQAELTVSGVRAAPGTNYP